MPTEAQRINIKIYKFDKLHNAVHITKYRIFVAIPKD